MQFTGNSSELVQPLGAEEGLILSLVGASATTKGGKPFASGSVSEKYVDYVQKVQDSDFVIPKEWNCPAESECQPTNEKVDLSNSLLKQEFLAYIQRK